MSRKYFLFSVIILVTGISNVKSLNTDILGVRQEESSTTETSSSLPPSTTITTPPLIEYVNYGESCQAGGLVLKLCNTYGRTVSCNKANYICECNLGEDAIFSSESNSCVGKVEAMCFLEATSLGRKVCVPNADCFTEKVGDGYIVGKCQCLYGYKEDSQGTCEDIDEAVGENERSTIRITTPRPTLPARVTVESTVSSITSPSTTGRNDNGGAAGLKAASGLILLFLVCYLIFAN